MKSFYQKAICGLLVLGFGSLFANEDPFLDRYRTHLKKAKVCSGKPNRWTDSYYVLTSITIDNGLEFTVRNDGFQHKESAEDEKRREQDCYKTKIGKEVHFELSTHYYTDRFGSSGKDVKYMLKPFFKRVDLSKSNLQAIFHNLPEIAKVEVLEFATEKEGCFVKYYESTYALQLTLSDSSVWQLDYGKTKPGDHWKIEDRIFVSVGPEKVLLVNVGRDYDKCCVRKHSDKFIFSGVEESE